MTPGFVLLLLFAAGCSRAQTDVRVDRLDVSVTVQDDGSAQVEERLAVRFGATPVSAFRRRLPVWRHDGVEDVVASAEGAPAQFQIAPGGALDVQWTFAPTSLSTRVFTLSYRARHVVAISGIRGTVSWRVLPPAGDFDVAAASVTLTLPDRTILLQDPWVDEAGWVVTRQSRGLTASRSEVARSESATAGVEFTIDQMRVLKPTWQFDEQRASEFMPAFVSAGLFILVTGLGILAMLRLKYGPTALAARTAGRLAAARDLRTTAWVVLIVGAGAWIFIATTMAHFGIWPLAIPASMLIVGVIFLAAAARMLYFARVRDGRISV